MGNVLVKFLRPGETFTNKFGVVFTPEKLEDLVELALRITKKYKLDGVGLEICNAVLLYANHFNPAYKPDGFLKKLLYQEVKKKKVNTHKAFELNMDEEMLEKHCDRCVAKSYRPVILPPLPPTHKALLQKLVAGKTLDEIAAEMGVTRMTLYRWRAQIRKEVLQWI